MIDIWQDGVRVYILPDDNFCLADNEHRSPLDLEECPEGHPYCTGGLLLLFGGSGRENCERGRTLGLGINELNLIKSVAENDIRSAKKYALAALKSDTTQKNRYYVSKYTSMLTTEGSNLFELPVDLRDILVCEDVSLSFHEDRYYVTELQKQLSEKIFRMSDVSKKLLELQIPYKNATLLYGPPGTGKTMFGRYIAYKKNLPFCYLNFSKVVDSYLGATSRNISKAFSYAASNPCVFLLDEVDAISCNRQNNISSGADKEIGRVTITLMQEFDKIPNDVIILAATNRMDILDKAFISRFPIKQEMKPFSREESICMVRKFLDNIQYVTAFSDTEIQNLIGEGGDQRQIMNYTIQALAEKIAEEKIYE